MILLLFVFTQSGFSQIDKDFWFAPPKVYGSSATYKIFVSTLSALKLEVNSSRYPEALK